MSRINDQRGSQNPVDRACERMRRNDEQRQRENVRPLNPDRDLSWDNQENFTHREDSNDY